MPETRDPDVPKGLAGPAGGYFRLVQISDPHLLAEPDGRLPGGVRPEARLARICTAVAEGEAPDCLLVTGDLAHEGTPDSYERLSRLLAVTGVPWYVLAGNHDDEEVMHGFFGESLMPGCIRAGGWRILLLSSVLPGQVAGQIGMRAGRDLAEALMEEPAGPTLVALHHPPVATGTPWLDAMGLADGRKFTGQLAGTSVRGVLFGHLHAPFETSLDGIRYYGAPSSAMQFVLGQANPSIETGWGGWQSYQLWPDGRIDSRVHRIEFEQGI